MQHVRTIFRLQAHYRATYCCGRHLTDGHVTGGHVTGLTSSLPHSEAVSNRHITPASDLNIKIYQPSYNDELKDIFGENKREHKEKVNFADFKSLQPELRERLKELGYEKPLPVQHRTLEATLRGKDAVIKSVTGSGKTLAFIIPLLNKVGAQRIGEERGRAPQAVIVAPTRELCRQIASVLEEFIGPERVSLMTAGLVKVKKQARQARLESKDIIVATPGRTMQLISNNIIRPKSLKFLVLDEADELLHDLFYQHMRWILDNSNPSKQMIVTTATVPSNVQFVIDRYMKYHEYIDLGAASVSLPEHIKHKAVLYDVGVFKRCLKWVLKNEHGSCSMLFVKHKDDCSRVTELVRSFGYSVKYINSDVPENSRVRVMSEFYENKFEILVATDLASRGVDVPECSLVVHIKPDLDNKKYIHRSGRTGRAGRQGTSVLMLVNEKDDHMDFLGNLSDIVNFDFYLYTNLLQYRLTPRDRL